MSDLLKKKEVKPTSKYAIGRYLSYLNNSKFFAGIVVLMLNICSKYITIKLSKTQEEYLKNSIGRQVLIFAIVWMGTRDIIMSLILTGIFYILTSHLFNEESKICVIPKKYRICAELLDLDGDGEISEEEIAKAKQVLKKAQENTYLKKKVKQRDAFLLSL